MGPHLQMRWDTWGSSQVVARNSAFISSCDGDLWAPLSCLKGSQTFSRALRGNLGLFSRCCRRKGPHLALTGDSRGLSRVAVGSLGFLCRYHQELREPLVLPQGSQVSIRVAKACAGVLWSHGRGIRPQFAWKGEPQGVSQVAEGSVVSLKLPRGPEGASHVVSRKSGILSSCEGPLGIPLELVQATTLHLELRR